MDVRKQFRAEKGLKLKDSAAGDKPLSSGDKTRDLEELAKLTEQISACQEIFYAEHKRKLLIVLQGTDTSGKDGTVRGVFSPIDPLGVRCIGFKAPTVDERERDFLWRVHREVPREGHMVIFNRSHYEDVLVPVVHGQIDGKECKRRYQHIRDFERLLAETGTVLLKFFLHISKDEQRQRLQDRLTKADKHWKVDLNDLEERKYWDEYQRLYATMIEETNTDHAPWYVIPADSKTHRNLAVASIVLETFKDMKLAYPPAHPEYFKLEVK